MAYMIAAVDHAFRDRVKTGYKPLKAYAVTLGELAKINAILEGYDQNIASEREAAVYEKTLRESLDDLYRPHAERLWPASKSDRT